MGGVTTHDRPAFVRFVASSAGVLGGVTQRASSAGQGTDDGQRGDTDVSAEDALGRYGTTPGESRFRGPLLAQGRKSVFFR